MFLSFATRNLLRNPRRTVAAVLTVALGTGSLFIFNGFNVGIMNQYRENTVHSRYGYGQINISGYRDTIFEKPWEHWITNYDEVAGKLRSVPGVTQLFPGSSSSPCSRTDGSRSAGAVREWTARRRRSSSTP